MSFGKKILEKYGYKEGEGLGKNSNGIIQPIKANFKFDNTGLGDKGPVKEDHWWERVFNEASTNVNVNKSETGEVAIDLKDEDGTEITNKSYSMKKLMKSNTKLQYGNFLKSATLLANEGGEKEIDGHVSTTDIEIKPIQVLSDEDLLKACGYRTAHKGARHGLKLSGKLQRIAEQEKALLEKLKTQKKTEVFKVPEETSPKKAKKRRIMDLNSSKDDSSDENELPINLEPNRPVPKSLIKKSKKQVNVLVDIMESIDLDKSLSQKNLATQTSAVEESKKQHPDTPVRKKKKKKINKESDNLDKIVEYIEQNHSEQSEKDQSRKKKKKKAKKRNLLDDDEKMKDVQKVETPPLEQPRVKPKRAKLRESLDTTSSESEKDIDKINELHHINMQNRKIAKAEAQNDNNFESSLKKKNKKGKKTRLKLLIAENWELKNQKKLEKYENKKLKYKLKQEKLLRQGGISKKANKMLKKQEKKLASALADTVELK